MADLSENDGKTEKTCFKNREKNIKVLDSNDLTLDGNNNSSKFEEV